MPHAAGVAIIFPVAHRVVKFDIISSDREEERKEDSEPGGTKRGTRLEIDEREEEEEEKEGEGKGRRMYTYTGTHM